MPALGAWTSPSMIFGHSLNKPSKTNRSRWYAARPLTGTDALMPDAVHVCKASTRCYRLWPEAWSRSSVGLLWSALVVVLSSNIQGCASPLGRPSSYRHLLLMGPHRLPASVPGPTKTQSNLSHTLVYPIERPEPMQESEQST